MEERRGIFSASPQHGVGGGRRGESHAQRKSFFLSCLRPPTYPHQVKESGLSQAACLAPSKMYPPGGLMVKATIVACAATGCNRALSATRCRKRCGTLAECPPLARLGGSAAASSHGDERPHPRSRRRW